MNLQKYSFEQQIRVLLEFRAMDAPVEISVPWKVLFYLDMHAERQIDRGWRGRVPLRGP